MSECLVRAAAEEKRTNYKRRIKKCDELAKGKRTAVSVVSKCALTNIHETNERTHVHRISTICNIENVTVHAEQIFRPLVSAVSWYFGRRRTVSRTQLRSSHNYAHQSCITSLHTVCVWANASRSRGMMDSSWCLKCRPFCRFQFQKYDLQLIFNFQLAFSNS